MKIDVENEFRKIAFKEVQSGKRRYRDALRNLKESAMDNSEYDSQELINSAGEGFAFSSELLLKSNLIYDDFRKNKRFCQTDLTSISYGDKQILCPAVGSNDWHMSISGYVHDFDDISQPKKILKDIILDNNPNDERNKINNDPQFNSQFLSLTLDGKRPSGHSLYAFYQLQSPIAKSLINSEYYCYVEDEVKYTIYALLTDDVLSMDNDRNITMPRDFMEKLDSVKEAAIDLRYASISSKNINENNLNFLKEFNESVLNVGEYRFPNPIEYEHFDFKNIEFNNTILNNSNFFNSLDKVTKFYLKNSFSDLEMNHFIKYISLLLNSGLSFTDINVFINNCIYFKNYLKNRMKIDIVFTEKQFSRIDKLCQVTKAFQPFDSNNKRLVDNEAFSTKEKICFYKNKIKEEQKKSDSKEENKDILTKIISYCDPKVNDIYSLKQKLEAMTKDDLKLRYNFINKYNLTKWYEVSDVIYSSNMAINFLSNYDKSGWQYYTVHEMLHYLPSAWYIFEKKYSNSTYKYEILRYTAGEFIDSGFYNRKCLEKLECANESNLTDAELKELFQDLCFDDYEEEYDRMI